ncbi:hypothetical protein J6590_063019 [Homalodisca vitripennis]|nr:hypothetical protein J6590_063019 [Homalodisca vitripennis]
MASEVKRRAGSGLSCLEDNIVYLWTVLMISIHRLGVGSVLACLRVASYRHCTVQNTKITMFADDVTLLLTGRDSVAAKNTMDLAIFSFQIGFRQMDYL